MMIVRCHECDWIGSSEDTDNDALEDGDGDLVGDVLLCPECGGMTEDVL